MSFLKAYACYSNAGFLSLFFSVFLISYYVLFFDLCTTIKPLKVDSFGGS